MKQIVALFVVIAIVLISGCTGDTNSGSDTPTAHNSNALKITTFSAEPTSAESSQDVYLELGIKNAGAQLARDTKVRIYNPPFGACTECWKIRNNNPACTSLGENWACLGDIYPPDSYTGFEGDEKMAYWNMRAPTLPSGSQVSYDLFARVYYEYESVATTQVLLINRNEGGSVGTSSPTITTSNGPIKFSVETKSPIVVSSSQDTLRFCIKARNVGGGTVYARGSPVNNILDEDLNLVHVSINFGGLDQVIDADMNLNQTYCTNFYPHEVPITKSIPVTITGSYAYYEDKDITLSVLGY